MIPEAFNRFQSGIRAPSTLDRVLSQLSAVTISAGLLEGSGLVTDEIARSIEEQRPGNLSLDLRGVANLSL